MDLSASQLAVEEQLQGNGIERPGLLVQHGLGTLQGEVPQHDCNRYARTCKNQARILNLNGHRDGDDDGECQNREDLLSGEFPVMEYHDRDQYHKVDDDTGIEEDMERSVQEAKLPSFGSDLEHQSCERVDQLDTQEQSRRKEHQKHYPVLLEAEAHRVDNIDTGQKRKHGLQAVEESVD